MSKNKNFGKQQLHEHTADIENVEVVDEVVEEIVETPVKEVAENKNIIGVVSGCELLNVRSKPEFTADVLTVIPAESIVTIIDVDASLDFYEVLIGDLKGFCMKKFIKIKE